MGVIAMLGRSNWRARHTVLLVLGVTWIATYIERTVMAVAMPYITAEYHLTPLNTGVVLGLFYAGYAISQVPGGLLADIFGVRMVATMSIVWRAIFVALTGAVSTVSQLFAVRVLFGLGDGVFPASAFKTIAVWFPAKERTRANAIMLAVMPLGTAIAPLLMIPIVSTWGWRAAFYSLLIPGIITAVLFWAFVKNRPPLGDSGQSEGSLTAEDTLGDQFQRSFSRTEVIGILLRPDVIKYFLIVLTYDTAYWGYWSWLPSYLVNARGFSLAQMGVAASLPSFGGIAGCLIGGWLSDKYFPGRRRIPIIVGQLVSAVLLYLTFTSTSVMQMLIYQTIGGIFMESFFSTFWALPMTTISSKQMGVTSGFINMAGQVAAFLSPIVIGFLVAAAHGGFALTFGFLIICMLVSSLVVLTISERPDKNQTA